MPTLPNFSNTVLGNFETTVLKTGDSNKFEGRTFFAPLYVYCILVVKLLLMSVVPGFFELFYWYPE